MRETVVAAVEGNESQYFMLDRNRRMLAELGDLRLLERWRVGEKRGLRRFIISLNFLQESRLLQKQQHRYLTCSMASSRRKPILLTLGVSEHLFIFTFR